MIKPDYYDKFRCIANRCHHTCCAGWEIDIDQETYERYLAMDGPLGKKLRDNIEVEEGPHFKLLGKEERCPFLNEDNLCEIILEGGEDKLCQICTDHPRFRNELNHVEEIGVGLCCEAAADLILGKKDKTVLLGREEWKEFEDPFEETIVKVRDRAFEVIQNRDFSMEERSKQILEEFEVRIPTLTKKEWIDFYLSLERMDEEWTKELEKLLETDTKEEELFELEIPFEQFFVYLLYRHLPQAMDETELKAELGYAYVNYKLLRHLCYSKEGKCDFTMFAELSRLFSSEIEYSEENTDEILDLIWEENEEF